MIYNIISTGSKGNAVVINNNILIDCGVPFGMLEAAAPDIQLVLLTHIHGDHFRPATIRRMAKRFPVMRWACGPWLVDSCLKAGIRARCLDVLEMDKTYLYGIAAVTPVELTHNVPTCGYKLQVGKERLFYATDTNSLNGIEAPGYDLYMVEANYDEETIRQKISDKAAEGTYSYERQVIRNHLSQQKCDEWLCRMMGPQSEFIYMHCHED